MNTIRAFVPDMGRVLAYFDDLKATSALARRTKSRLPAEEVHKTLRSGDAAIARKHEDGSISPEEFFAKAKQLLQFEESFGFEAFVLVWKDIFAEIPGTDALLRRLRKDVKLGLLSNTDPIHWEAIRELPVMQEFFADETRLARSFDVGFRKPDSGIYMAAVERLGVEPEHILYVDDIRDYVRAARALGFNAEWYDATKHPVDRLKEILEAYDLLED